MARLHRTVIAACAIAVGAGCSSRTDLEQVPIGAKVEVTRQDGGVVRGTLTARDPEKVRMAVGPAARTIPRAEIASVEVVDGATPPPLPAVARFRELTVPAGTILVARLGSALGSDTSQVGDAVTATLATAVRVDGAELMPVGSVLTGVVASADPSGKVKGRAGLGVRFRSVTVPGHAGPYALSGSVNQTAASTRADDAKKIGIPAAGGAVIGAIIGGKKGAAIGGAIGGGAGATVVLVTPGDEVRWPEGTTVSVALDEDLDVRVPIEGAPGR